MLATTERRGPHKSMHCKFCKPPGTVYFSDIPSPEQLETKTKLHLSHDVADLKIYDIYDEPGVVPEEEEACVCQLEGAETCPKCAPDKTRKPEKKKVCDCPPGAKPNANVAALGVSSKKKKKEKVDDNEFWWEKYDREHDAKVKEMWNAYMTQRKLDRKLSKTKEKIKMKSTNVMKPEWFQKLSCQQVIYLEHLSTAIRLDLDENITDRTSFILGHIGLCPRPKKKMLQKCLRYCHYNSIDFLNQLLLLSQDEDPYEERIPIEQKSLKKGNVPYAWNDRIIMSCICHLEFPEILREIMDRLPPLWQEPLPPVFPLPTLGPKPIVKKNASPYDEPVWVPQINWLEVRKVEVKNQYRECMSLKRVKIPSLALVRRPSLIDARPAYLPQIEAIQNLIIRRKTTKRRSSTFRKKKKATFDSKVDVTAIAGIPASEVSTTPKADPEDEICVFLRENEPVTESIQEEPEMEADFEEEEEEEEAKIEAIMEPKVRTVDIQSTVDTSTQHSKTPKDMSVFDRSSDKDDIPFVTPPKTQSGRTIDQPCPPPLTSPGPPASHYDIAMRQIGIINEELCLFNPNDSKFCDDEDLLSIQHIINIDVERQLKQVVRRLRELNLVVDEKEEEEKDLEEIQKAPEKKRKKRKGKKGDKAKVTNMKNPAATEKQKRKKKDEPVQLVELTENPTTVIKNEEKSDERKKLKKKGKRGKIKKRKRSKKKVKGKKKKKKADKTAAAGKEKKVQLPAEQTRTPAETERKVEKEKDGTVGAAEKDSSSDEESDEKELEKEEEEVKETVYRGNVLPLLKVILKDLNEEGFVSAGYKDVHCHPDIKQLIMYLRGEILSRKKKKQLKQKSLWFWKVMGKAEQPKALAPELKISQKTLNRATWNDKNWIEKLAVKNRDFFYFHIAKNRANETKTLYASLNQEYLGTEKFLKAFYAYMVASRQDCIVKGVA